MDTAFATPHLNELVFQHNNLVRAPLKLSNIEARIFALCLACLHQRSDSLAVEVDIKDVVKARGGEAYEQVREGCVGLTSKPVRVETVAEKGLRTFLTAPLFSVLKLEEGTGRLTGSFNHELRQHLLQLSKEFTRCEVQTLLTLKSAYAHKLYWILKSWEKPSGTVTIPLDNLRDMLMGQDSEGYPLWADFKRYVLEPARKELEKVAWPVVATENKTGKKVTSVTFTIPLQVTEQAFPGSTKTKLTPEQLEEYLKHLNAKWPPLVHQYQRMQLNYKLTEPQARSICNAIKSEDMFQKLTAALHQVTLARVNNLPIKNLPAFTLTTIKEALPGIFK